MIDRESEGSPARQVVETFRESVPEAFGYLLASHRLEWGLRAYVDEDIVTIDVADLSDQFFWADATFVNAESRIRVSIGERELIIETIIRQERSAAEYALWEWLEALERNPRPPRDAESGRPRDRVRKVVGWMGAALQGSLGDILAASPWLIARAEAARADRHAEWQRMHAADRHRVVAAMAAEAFRAGRFAQVVELLEAVKPRLTPAEQKKLEYARAHAGRES